MTKCTTFALGNEQNVRKSKDNMTKCKQTQTNNKGLYQRDYLTERIKELRQTRERQVLME